jgi:HAD superfamily hydrolase (TIGR01509 family)
MFDVFADSRKTNESQRQTTGYPRVNTPKKIEAVALDMDGLLLNTEDLYQEVCQTLMARRGKKYDEEVRRKMIGLPAPLAFGVLIEHGGLTDSWQQLQEETDALFEGILEARLEPMPGVGRLMETIRTHGLPRCVATSSTTSFATKVLDQVGLLSQLDFLITAEEVGKGKPHPDIYLAAAQRMGVSPDAMLVLEDSETGTKAGVSAGANVISVPNEHTRHGRFEGARLIAETLQDARIYAWLSHGR